MSVKRIGILVVAYNAATTLAQVLDRIPSDFRSRITMVHVGDDASQDSTHLVALGYGEVVDDLPIEVIRHPLNLGYGGNQKAGYEWAIANDLDIVVLLHGDGQYAPELLPEIVAPLERGEADAVFGSRMLDRGGARRGGMPRYKFVGNRILTAVENAVAGASLSEWHSGYRAYSVAALSQVPFARNDDGFNFDTQVIVQFLEAGKRIVEVPIPTYYGDEICRVNGMAYARDITRDVARYRAHKMGFGSGELAFASDPHDTTLASRSSQELIIRWIENCAPMKVLELGYSDGALAERIRGLGHEVTGVGHLEHDVAKDCVDYFIEAEPDAELPLELDGPYDLILATDVLEHSRDPRQLLDQLHARLAPGGSLIATVPNFGHWYPRLRVLLGRFDYDRLGILDRSHIRFFTRRSFERLIRTTGFRTVRRTATGLPVEVVDRGRRGRRNGSGRAARLFARLDRGAVAVRPELFAYQLIYEMEREHPGSS